MADTLLLKALRGNARKVNLNNKNLKAIPRLVGKLSELDTLEARNNKICYLPSEMALLVKLANFNLGCNELQELPKNLIYLSNLRKLHLFNNNLTELDGEILGNLHHLTLLNLNKNNLQTLPKEIGRLVNLEFLSLDDNQLIELPDEFCKLTNLKELSICRNQLISLPDRLGKIRKLKKLFLYRNELEVIPDSVGKMYQLSILDISINNIRLLPSELLNLPLTELHIEGNPLIDRIPVHCNYADEVLSLKECAARYILKDLKKRDSIMRFELRYNDEARELLLEAKECPICTNCFLNSWLECAEFVNVHKILGIKNRTGDIPMRVQLCSYKCFRSDGHNYLGVAAHQV